MHISMVVDKWVFVEKCDKVTKILGFFYEKIFLFYTILLNSLRSLLIILFSKREI
jgi:hypothetical protein